MGLLRLFAFLALLAGAGFGLLLLRSEADFIVFVTGPHRVQVSLPLFLLLLLLLLLLFGLLGNLFRSGGAFLHWARGQGRRRANLALHKGFAELVSGRLGPAGKSLLAHIKSGDEPLAGYFALARLAEREGEPLRGAEQMAEGRARHPELDQLLALEEAQFLLQAGETGRALAVADTLPADLPAATELRARLALRTGEPADAAGLLAVLGGRETLLEKKLLLAGLASAASLAEVNSLLKALPRRPDEDPEIGLAEVEARMRLDDRKKAAARLKALMAAQLPNEPEWLMDRYLGLARRMKLPDSRAQLDKWRQSHPGAWSLPYARAQLHLEAGALDEAEAELRLSLQTRPTRPGLKSLGELLQRRGRLEEAMECYRRALYLDGGGKPSG